MRLKTTGALLLACAAVSGCVTLGKAEEVYIGVPFNLAEATASLQPGPNTIKGNAFIRQNGGGVVTCAGNAVFLVPATAYAIARFESLYGNARGGFSRRNVKFTPDEPEYRAQTRETRCDAAGSFEFAGLADGDFFVTTSVVWTVSYASQGGYVMQRTRVSGGRTINVVVAP